MFWELNYNSHDALPVLLCLMDRNPDSCAKSFPYTGDHWICTFLNRVWFDLMLTEGVRTNMDANSEWTSGSASPACWAVSRCSGRWWSCRGRRGRSWVCGSYIIEQGVRPWGWPASIFSTSRIILLNTSTAVWTHTGRREEDQRASGGEATCPTDAAAQRPSGETPADSVFADADQ